MYFLHYSFQVFHPRSWTSFRVMTAEQRMELLSRVTNVDREKKISLKDCIRIARELDLTVEQVSVYYLSHLLWLEVK